MNVLTEYRYNLKCSLHTRSGGQHRIYISAKSMALLRTIVEPHMDRSMRPPAPSPPNPRGGR
jgi:hypothetical protein